MNYKVYELHSFCEENGSLTAFEKGSNVPFDVRRAFYIYDTKGDTARGCHANRKSEFLLVVISGSCRVRITNGSEEADVLLNKPHQALYLDKMLWKEMYEFSYNSVLLVLSNELYNEEEYIRNYNEYLTIVNQ